VKAINWKLSVVLLNIFAGQLTVKLTAIIKKIGFTFGQLKGGKLKSHFKNQWKLLQMS
jgi:hypothetical protein